MNRRRLATRKEFQNYISGGLFKRFAHFTYNLML